VLTAIRKRLKKKFIVNKPTLYIILFFACIIFIIPALIFGMSTGIPLWLSIVVSILPVITTLVSFLYKIMNDYNKKNLLTGTKFTRFPLIAFFDPEPASFFRFKPKQTGWWNVIEEGDLLLRRHDHYLDGLILRQTGFYTHAGIAKKEDNGSISVFHAVSEGVCKISIEDFSRCDDILVLRITEQNIVDFFNKQKDIIFTVQANKLWKPTFKKRYEHLIPTIPEATYPKDKHEPAQLNDIRKMIEASGRQLNMPCTLLNSELSIFDDLKNHSAHIFKKNWRSVITKIAEFYYEKNTEYDFKFDFVDPERMSCVEFAWNCYKCFYPMHTIQRKTFTFFSMLDAFILAPDQFTESIAFSSLFKSPPEFDTRDNFLKFCKKKSLNFWKFIGFCIVLQLLTLSVIKLFVCLLWHQSFIP